MKQRLLEYIICPHCRAALRLVKIAADGEEIMEGELVCSGCGTVFQITRGIARLLPSEISAEKKATAEAFGYEWTRFTELTDKYQAQFLDWIAPITKDYFSGKIVLDAGTGKGRHAYLASQFGAREVIGIDLSEAVEIAYQNTRALPNVHIVQADIYHLPFRAPFDYVYSIGVLHHLPDPKKGFLSLLRHLKPGARISAWVYGKEGNWWIERILNPIRVHITSRLPKIVTRVISFVLALVLQLLLKAVYSPVNRRLPALKPLLFYNDYLYSISGFSFRENYSIVFDHLIAPTAFYISRSEFEKWFSEGNLKEISVTQRNANSWRGTGIKNF